MKLFRSAGVLAMFFSLLVWRMSVPAAAVDVSFTAEVGDTAFTLSGETFPKALVTFRENDAVIGTTIADSGGNFSKEFTSQQWGPRVIKITASDAAAGTREVSVSFVAIRFFSITVSDLILPPLIQIGQSAIPPSGSLFVDGKGPPGSPVTIQFNGPTARQESKIIESDGTFSHVFSAGQFLPGTYSITASIDRASNVSSTTSTAKTVVILAPSPTPGPTATPKVLLPSPEPTGAADGTGSSSFENVENTAEKIDKRFSLPGQNRWRGLFMDYGYDTRTGAEEDLNCSFLYKRLCYFWTERQNENRLLFEDEFMSFFLTYSRLFGSAPDTQEIELIGTAYSVPSTAFDINRNGVIDLPDFSIALFYSTAPRSAILGVAAHDRDNIPDTAKPPGFGGGITTTVHACGSVFWPFILTAAVFMAGSVGIVLSSRIICRDALRQALLPAQTTACRRQLPCRGFSRKHAYLLVFGTAGIAALLIAYAAAVCVPGIPFLSRTSLSLTSENDDTGGLFERVIAVESAGTPVNAIQADLSFNPDVVEVVRIDTSTSIAKLFVMRDYSNTGGWIRVAGGIPGTGFYGENGTYARIIFRRRAPGNPEIALKASSRMFAADGKGTDLPVKINRLRLMNEK